MTEESTKGPEEGGSSAAPPLTEAPERLRSRVRWGLVALVALAVALGFIAYQNIGDVSVRAFWWEFKIPLLVVIVATAILTLVVQRLVWLVLRWRRRRTRHDGERTPRHGRRRR